MRQVLEQQVHAPARFEILVHHDPDPELEVESARRIFERARRRRRRRADSSLPWFAIYLLSPFSETFREMREMRYLWSRSLLLDNRKLVAFLGREPHTPLDEALRTTLAGLGCVGAQARALTA